ncbi:hypothetical protein L6164_031283 [Bauhinia variegata]|uniref:Uncharacterized protein n=1 Tax=Bauhinia variegata TaxID=167791 RepID=A0ACB9LFA6_BAUVA|nr:hypothetical protein L6164_031283 [Bauhinia variegata]
MSRHRRQASQVLPPEIIAGEDLSKPFDVNQVIAGTASGGTSATISIDSKDPHATSKEKEAHHLIHSPATSKKPPAGKSA